MIAPKSPLVQFPTNFSQYLHQIIYRISILLVLQATTSHTATHLQSFKVLTTMENGCNLLQVAVARRKSNNGGDGGLCEDAAAEALLSRGCVVEDRWVVGWGAAARTGRDLFGCRRRIGRRGGGEWSSGCGIGVDKVT